jgi:hypothetical protein
MEPNRADEMVTAKPETVNRAWWACRAISIRVVKLGGKQTALPIQNLTVALTNDTSYPSAVPSSRHLVRPEVLADPAVFPSPEVYHTLVISKPITAPLMRLQNRLWAKLKTD